MKTPKEPKNKKSIDYLFFSLYIKDILNKIKMLL